MATKIIIGIEIDGQKIMMTEEAAKELYRKLDSMFGTKPSYTIAYPTYPYTYPQKDPFIYQPTITCIGNLDSDTVTGWTSSGNGVNVSYTVAST